MLALWAGLPSATAALPKPNTTVVAYDHGTGGHDTHVQLDIAADPRRIAGLTIYAQDCASTVYVPHLRINDDGTFAFHGDLRGRGGTWSIVGRFPDPNRATGTWSMSSPGACDLENVPFTAYGPDAKGDVHIIAGNPAPYPDAARMLGQSRTASRLRAIHHRSLAAAHRYDSLAKAAALGYVLDPYAMGANSCPGIFHSRKDGVQMWGGLLDARTPQSLVWWCDSSYHFTLIAFMYRAPASMRQPKTFGGLLQWHKHAVRAGWMTHDWLVHDDVSAWATCLPWPALEREGIVHYEPYIAVLHSSYPCPDTDRHGLP